MTLSRLTKVDLREAWPHEPADFTSKETSSRKRKRRKQPMKAAFSANGTLTQNFSHRIRRSHFQLTRHCHSQID